MNFDPLFMKKEKEECVGSTKKGQMGGEVHVPTVRYKNVNEYSVRLKQKVLKYVQDHNTKCRKWTAYNIVWLS